MRKKPAALSVPLRRKEEFSLFKVSDDEYKVKISPQLLLATQRFLSRGEDEGWFLSPLSCLSVRRPWGSPCLPIPVSRSVQEHHCAPGCPGSRDTPLDTLRSPKGTALLHPTSKSRARLMHLCEPLPGSLGWWCVALPSPLVLGRGLGLRASQEIPGGQQASVCLRWPLRAQWTLSSLCRGQRWMCSAHCESPRRSCCTC